MIRSNNLAPRAMPQPITENQRNPLVNCSRDIVWLPSWHFALVAYGLGAPTAECQRGVVLKMSERSDRPSCPSVRPLPGRAREGGGDARVAAAARARRGCVCGGGAYHLAPIARGRGPVAIAIGEGLDLLSTG